MEKFMYPSPYMRITQGYMQGSHKSSYAIDDGGSGSGKDYAIAPYSGTVKRIYSQFENEVFFESDNPVEFADGSVDYATTMFVHQDSPMAYGMAVGKHYNQGDKIYIEGGRYAGKNAHFASHFHLEFAKGKFADWYKNSAGYYSLRNAKKPEDCCFIDDSYHILNSNGYKFKHVRESKTNKLGTPVARDTTINQLKVKEDNVRARDSANGKMIGYMKPGIYNSLRFITKDGYDWHEVENGLWFANGTWSDWLPAEKKEDPPVVEEDNSSVEALQKKLAEQEDIINNLNAKTIELSDTIIDKDKEIATLKEQLATAPKLIFESPKSDYYAIKLNENEKLYLG